MKRSLIKLMTVAGIVLAGGLTASAEQHLFVKVPFTFVLAGLQFAPGEYNVYENNNGIITVQGAGRAAAVLSVPAESAKDGDATALRFTTEGSEHRLVGVQVEGAVTRAIPVPQDRKLLITSR